MKPIRLTIVTILATLVLALTAQAAEPLSSWNDGPAKQAILSFVKEVTDKSNPKYVEPEDRIATFDQDGTLWVEHPLYTQAMFALDRVRELAPKHPEWRNKEPFKAVIMGNREAIAKFSESDWEIIVASTHTGMGTESFLEIVKKWLATAKHPRFERPYTELIYHPMIELMDYLRANGFKTYIVTGGGQDFVRVYSERIPPEQIVGTAAGIKYGYDKSGKPILTKEPKVLLNDNNAGMPEGIHLMIGARPIIAFGNSTGDRQMLEYTKAGDGARLALLVLHDDAQREYVYGPTQGLPDNRYVHPSAV
jgi:phosphoserine phosphatase